MKEITHCHNQRPVYETGSGDTYTWDSPLEVSGEVNYPDFPTYHPFIIDIETSAELGQRPILMVGYNSLSNHLVVLYNYGYQDYILEKDTIRGLIDSVKVDAITVDNLSQSKFEQYVLRSIADWNKKARKRGDEHRISLVAHNASFDIPMMGSPDDGLLQVDKIGSQYEQAVQYKDVRMVGHRAGQFGHIFTFLDATKSYESMHIPVGDTLVASKAMWLDSVDLAGACEQMGVDIDVSESEKHGNLTDEYVKYCINDVEATYKLYRSLQGRIESMFGVLPIERIYSTASIGKYVLRSMGYKRVGYSQNAVDTIAPAYFGGRTDAHITGEIVDNLRYTDILSQYPTVSKLTGVWEFMKYETVDIRQIDAAELPEIGDLTDPDTWEHISDYYVKIIPNGATLPVRTPHLEDTTKVVTANVHSDTAIHYHYMDIIAAELIDNERNFDIVCAWEVYGKGKQDLEATDVAGIDIEPEDNVMAKCIESRKEIQYDVGEKNSRTNSLKITANSLYGISAERIVKEIDELIESERHDFAAKNGFYNPHVATTITASGRLQLALGQHIAESEGGELVYCDTDSLVLSEDCAQTVIDEFESLNPYDGYAGTLETLEDEKGEIGKIYAVGTKKYIFFNDSGEVLEYKEHGLGNYENLRDGDIIKRLWATILYYDLSDNPLDVDILYDGKMNERVLWSFNASTVSMRTLIDQFSDDFIRYGDWVQSTLSYNDERRYIGLNLMEKEDSDTVCMIETEGEEVVNATEVSFEDMKNDESLKVVRDVVMKFVQDANVPDEKPEVFIDELRCVTKESTSRTDVFVAALEKSFRENMKIAVEWVFES